MQLQRPRRPAATQLQTSLFGRPGYGGLERLWRADAALTRLLRAPSPTRPASPTAVRPDSDNSSPGQQLGCPSGDGGGSDGDASCTATLQAILDGGGDGGGGGDGDGDGDGDGGGGGDGDRSRDDE